APTFTKDVAPLLHARCVSCHQPGGDGPFSLVSYDDVRRRAHQIAAVTAKRYMPPWKPDADSPRFAGDRRLSGDEIALIRRWGRARGPARRSSTAAGGNRQLAVGRTRSRARVADLFFARRRR